METENDLLGRAPDKIQKEKIQEEIKPNSFSVLDNKDIEILRLIEESQKKLHFLYKQFFIFLISIVSGMVIIWASYAVFASGNQFIFILCLILSVLAGIFFIFSSVLSIIKLIWDRRRLKEWLVQKFSNNYIVANFWTASKRIKQHIYLVKHEVEIYHEKDLYIINKDNIWHDNRRRPNIYFVEGYPNSININLSDDIKKYNETDVELRNQVKNKKGDLIDLAFDADGLRSYKNTAWVKELLKEDGDNNPIMIILIILVVIIIGIFIFMIWKSSQPVAIIAQNVTNI